ncbi:MAG: DUF177 domain-containing protein [Pseudomonadota bacterium]|nr:DUF177 domain-containing protein [Pseudomonadota bacterium]
MSFPVVPLESIPTHGLTVQVQDWGRAACGEGLGGEAGAVSGHLVVTRQGRHILVSGTLEGSATVVCDRCAEPLRFTVAGEVDCVYIPRDEVAAQPVDEEPPEEAREEGEYDGVELDLVHVVREFFALERPARILCGDLDPAADAACLERFRTRAALAPAPPDPRFSVLKGVKPTR